MTNEKQLHRSRKALIGGVCAGVADYFEVDPLVVRIIAVAFACASAGLLGFAYAVLWIILPLEPKEEAPFDVEPQSVHSDTYGTVDFDASRTGQGSCPQAPSPARAASWRYTQPAYTSAAHVPPEPPSGAERSHPIPPAQSTPPPYPPPAGAPYEGWQPPVPQPPYTTYTSHRGVKAALWIGSFLLCLGVSSLVASMIEGVVWWQYWPLIFVILGIVNMVVPGKEGRRMRKFVDGLMAFSTGVMLVLMSLDVIAWESIGIMLSTLWPLLIIVVGLLVLGGALKSPMITLLAGLFFVAFCVVGVIGCSVPGTTEELVISAPYGREYHFDMQPWERNASVEVPSTLERW